MQKNDGNSLESYVQYVYQSLLNLRDEGVMVSKRTKLRGKSGAMHEVDVFYEFVRAGIRHRVAVECKDLSRPVTKGDITEFHGKVQDIGGISALVVSRSGYQEGARLFAKHWDILLLGSDELPAINTLLASRLEAVALPDEACIGEPFWTIMELRNGKVTGSYFCHLTNGGAKRIPLTFSKPHAQQVFAQARLNPEEWGIRGMPRRVLRAFILMMELMERQGGGAVLCVKGPGETPNSPFIGMPITREELALEYYGEAIPRIAEAP